MEDVIECIFIVLGAVFLLRHFVQVDDLERRVRLLEDKVNSQKEGGEE